MHCVRYLLTLLTIGSSNIWIFELLTSGQFVSTSTHILVYMIFPLAVSWFSPHLCNQFNHNTVIVAFVNGGQNDYHKTDFV